MMNGGLVSDFGRDSRTPRDAHDDLVDVVRDEGSRLLRLGVHVLVELLDDVGEDLVRGLVEVRDLCGMDALAKLPSRDP